MQEQDDQEKIKIDDKEMHKKFEEFADAVTRSSSIPEKYKDLLVARRWALRISRAKKNEVREIALQAMNEWIGYTILFADHVDPEDTDKREALINSLFNPVADIYSEKIQEHSANLEAAIRANSRMQGYLAAMARHGAQIPQAVIEEVQSEEFAVGNESYRRANPDLVKRIIS